MKRLVNRLMVYAAAFASCQLASGQPLTNGQWTIDRIDGETVRLTGPDGASADFGMTFRLFLATSDPDPAKTQVSGVRYNGGTSWVASVPDPNSGIGGGDNPDFGDGFDPDIVTDPGSRTANLFNAAASKEIRPVSDTVEADGIRYQFAADSTFVFSARIAFDGETGVPTISTTLTATGTAWFSVAYLGAPASAFAETQQIWQPLVWQDRRFPSTSYLTASYLCPLPSSLVTKAGSTVGVVAHPDEFPFMPLPLFENSRFGVAVRNAAGEAQPILAAPILGGTGSRLTEGQSFTFRICPFVTTGDTTIAFERIARDLYDFRDVRHNQIGSLNVALDNMVDYGMSAYSGFIEKDKGLSYETDAPGTVKNVSSLSPVDMALTTDNGEIWKKRAYPYIEYMLSRQKFLFTTDETQQTQSPAYTLEGPVAPISELLALNRISNGSAAEMLELAETEYGTSRIRNFSTPEPGGTWQNALQLYRATGEASYLQTAIQGADAYIARRITNPPVNFNDPDANLNFWSGYAPRFVDLLLIYEATNEPRFLDAAWKGARFYAMYCWFAPRIPDTNVTVNQGNKAPVYWYLANRTDGPISIPEESVPAWRVSEQGLTNESSGTSTGHRAIFMANHAPWLLRLAWLKDDDFLRDVARSAMVGRWMNFPGYHMNTGRTTVYEKPDYPLRPFNKLSYNSFHFNHIWPLMSVALDYLVTDAETRSDGAIAFEREFIEGYAYLQSSFYGMRPGKFYGEQPVRLWMPQKLANISTTELNYIAARGADSLCLAFTNQNFSEETATVTLDTNLVPELAGRTRNARVWIDNQPVAPIQVVNGTFSLTVPAKGIAAVVIDSTEVTPAFQEGFADLTAQDAWLEGHLEWTTPAARALMLNFGSEYRSFYFYLKDSKRDFSSLRLRYEIDGRLGEVTDAAFPWEFTVPLGADDQSVLFELHATRPDGSVVTYGPSTLVKDATSGLRLGDSTATRRVIPGSTIARIPGQRLLDAGVSTKRVSIASAAGRFLDGTGANPVLSDTARKWHLTEVNAGEFTIQDAFTGKYLTVRPLNGIDGPTQEVFASADQRIESTSPSNSLPPTWALRVGPLGGSEAVRSLLRFDLSGLPAAPDGVELKLVRDANHAGGPANLAQEFAVYQLTRGFVNGQATWLSAATGNPWTTPGGDVGPAPLVAVPYNPSTASAGQTLVFPDQPAFRSAVNNVITAGGSLDLLIRSDQEASADRSEAYFRSSEQPAHVAPRLVFDYSTAFISGSQVSMDASAADRFALDPVDGGGTILRHLGSGFVVNPGAANVSVSFEPGATWTLTETTPSQLTLGNAWKLRAVFGGLVDAVPAGATGDADRWEVTNGPNGAIQILHTASGEVLTLVEKSPEWIEIPIVEDVRIRPSGTGPQPINGNLAVGSVSATDTFRTLLRFNLSVLPAGYAPDEVELALDVKSRDSTSQSASHTLEVFRVTQPYNFAQVTWSTAGPGAWSQPGGTHDPAVLASTSANPASVIAGQDLVFPGTSAFAAAIQTERAGDQVLDLMLRSNRENTNRSFFWLTPREDVGVSGPRLRVRSSAPVYQLALRPLGSSVRQSFRWIQGSAGTLLKEDTSGNYFSINGEALEFTVDAASATSVQVTEPETSLRLSGSPLDGRYLSTWCGAVDPSFHPWCYHSELGWIYLGWEKSDALWGWTESLGWIYTSKLTYPLCFSQNRQEWMLIENLPDETEICFTGLDSHVKHRIPSATGFNVAGWLVSGSIPAPSSSPPAPPVDSAPAVQPTLGRATRLLPGPGGGVGSWRLVAHGRASTNLLLHDSIDLLNWWWLDGIQTVDEGPVIFQLTTEGDSRFWQVDWQDD